MVLKKNKYDQNEFFWRDFSNLPGNPYKLREDLSNLNCLLVFPTKEGDFSKSDYPLSLGYMASLLRMNRGSAEILLQDIEKYKKEKFKGKDLIFFYPMISLLDQTIAFSKKIKKDFPYSKIGLLNSDQHQHEMLLCAPDAKNFARKLIEKNKSLDYILFGEAESSFIQLCDNISKQETDLKDVPACIYRKDGQIKISEKPIKPVEFNFLPFASRDYLEKTISPEGINSQSPRVQSSRGCMSPCLYCAESRSNITKGGRKKPILNKSISSFIQEIKLLQEEYGAVFFNIIDSSFEDPGKKGIERMKTFCKEIGENGIQASFKIHLRAENISKMDDSFLDMLKYAGVDIIIPGVESGLEKELKSYRKITTPEQSRKSILRLEEHGKFFSVMGHMMFTPILDLEDLPLKLDYLKSLNHEWDYLNLSNNIIIFPGTAYHAEMDIRGLILDHDELSPRVPYKFQDPRVADVANEMADLKLKHPEIMKLNNRLYDAKNILSRFYNKINKHLLANEPNFNKFRSTIEEIVVETGNIQSNLFLDFVYLAQEGWNQETANLLFHGIAGDFFDLRFKKTDEAIKGFLADCESKNLPTNKLYLKTWMSLINTQINTSGEKSE